VSFREDSGARGGVAPDRENERADRTASTFLDDMERNGQADRTASTFLDDMERNGRADRTASTFLDDMEGAGRPQRRHRRRNRSRLG
jgi:hypothetical protein